MSLSPISTSIRSLEDAVQHIARSISTDNPLYPIVQANLAEFQSKCSLLASTSDKVIALTNENARLRAQLASSGTESISQDPQLVKTLYEQITQHEQSAQQLSDQLLSLESKMEGQASSFQAQIALNEQGIQEKNQQIADLKLQVQELSSQIAAPAETETISSLQRRVAENEQTMGEQDQLIQSLNEQNQKLEEQYNSKLEELNKQLNCVHQSYQEGQAQQRKLADDLEIEKARVGSLSEANEQHAEELSALTAENAALKAIIEEIRTKACGTGNRLTQRETGALRAALSRCEASSNLATPASQAASD
ncbi:MAG: hypothetical protein JSS61_02075 [Verrucomicrobia bacterium]|nr:hypothetical protein [Verrucomicrobiota bacterium]